MDRLNNAKSKIGISVLIPVYNCERYLAEAILSVIEQTEKAVEIIIIDDGSTDRTPEIAESFSEVRLIRTVHRGVSFARNRGIAEAIGDWIAFLDADDLWEKRKLEKQAAFLCERPWCDAVFTEVGNFSDIPENKRTDRQKTLMAADIPQILPSACIRRALFEKFGYFDTSLERGEDTEWLYRMTCLKIDMNQKINEVLYRRRVHDGNMSLEGERFSSQLQKTLIARAIRNASKIRKAKLSVVIPAYNAEKYLGNAIRSLECQVWNGEIQTVVVDDGSTDKTCAIAEHSGCVVIRQDHQGAAAARNAGIRAADGEYVFLLDADDRLEPHALETLLRPFWENDDLAGVFARAEDFISPELPENEKQKLKVRQGPYGGVLPGCALIRREVYEKIGLFNTELKSAETVDWQMRLKDSGLEICNLETVVLKRRLHLTNTGRVNQQQERQNYAALLRARMQRQLENSAKREGN